MERLREIMRPDFLITVQPDATVGEAARAMAEHNVGIVAVLADERLAGVFSERDAVRQVMDRGLDPAQTAVSEVMTTDVIIADADEEYASAMLKMDQANIRHLPVCSGGRLLAMLSIRDLMRAELRDKGDEIKYLHEYLYHAPSASPPIR